MIPRPTGTPGDENFDDLLRDPHCKYLLEFLWRTDGATTVDAAAGYIAGAMTDTASPDIPENVRRRVAIWLHHGQLPTLAAHGLVEFDPERRTVELAEDDVSPLLLAAAGAEPDRSADEPC
jgi:hypothetical protein